MFRGLWFSRLPRTGRLYAASFATLLALSTTVVVVESPVSDYRFYFYNQAQTPGPIPFKEGYPSQPEVGRASAADSAAEINCLALNIYFEARDQSDQGKLAVGYVVMNRALDSQFPDTACEVIQDGGDEVRNRCQFSWWCDGLSDLPSDLTAWESSKQLAGDVYWGRTKDPSEGALWYHADYVQPAWGFEFAKGPKLGKHIFYQRAKPGDLAATRLIGF